jgi:DNA-binding NarL/FixJ family response regulator
MRVVIADDSYLMRERIRELITGNTNVEVVGESENGLSALEMIKLHRPDLAIIDIRMPGMSGIALLNKIREMNLKVKTCILTNYPSAQYRKKCIEAGVDYFLSKADGFDDLNAIIESIA